jgi:hypothetical protein
MKKLIIILLLFIGFKASAQNTVTLPSGTVSYTPAFRYGGSLTDSLKSFWFNVPGGGYNQWYSGTYVNKYFLRKTDFVDSLANKALYFSTNFQGYGSMASPLDLADSVTINQRLRIGISSAPAWNSLYKIVNMAGNVGIRSHYGTHDIMLFNNLYNISAGNTWHYSGTGFGSFLYLDNGGGLEFFSAPSGTSADSISLTVPVFSVTRTGATLTTMRDTVSADTVVGYLRGELVKIPFTAGGGSDSTIYKTDGTIISDRVADIGLHSLTFHGQSATDSITMSLDHALGFGLDHYNKITHLDGNLYISPGFFDGEAIDSLGNRADVVATASVRNSLSQLLAVNNTLVKSSQLTINTNASATGAPEGFTILDDIYHRGISYTSYTDYINADSLTLMPKQYNDAHYAAIGSGGTTNNSATFNNSGSGATSGTTFDGSAARTISYNTIGAQPTLVSGTNIKTVNSNSLLGSGNVSVGTLTSLTPGIGFVSHTPITTTGTADIDTVSTIATQYDAFKLSGPDGIVSGLVTTVASPPTAVTTAGVYKLNNALVTKGSSTNTTLDVQDATRNRYDLIVGDASGTLSVVSGVLAADAVEPDIPTNKALIASVYIPSTGGTVTPTGGGTGKGTVTKVTSSTTDILVANQTTTPILTLNKVNGVTLAFFDPTSSIQTQLNGKQATLVSGTNIKTVNGNSLVGSGNVTISTGLTTSNFVFNEIPSGTIDGSNVTFTLANTPVTGTIQLFKNGFLLKPTTDYSVSGSTITMVTAPSNTGYSDVLLAHYLK